MNRILLFITILMIGGCSSEKGSKPLADFDALWDYNKPAETELKFRELLSMAEESRDLSYHIQLLTQIARAKGLQGRFDDAHRTLDSTEAMLTDELRIARIRYFLERGRVYNSSGNPDKAGSLFVEAWELALAEDEDFYAIDVAHMLGIVKPPKEQLDWNIRAMDLAERSSDERAKGWLGSLYNNIGWTYHDLKQYDKALEMFQKSLNWREERGDDYGVIIARWCVARTYRSLERIDEALGIQRALEVEIDDKGLPPDGYVYEELGECLLLIGEEEEAQDYFRKAYDILSKDEWLKANQPERLERLKRMSYNE